MFRFKKFWGKIWVPVVPRLVGTRKMPFFCHSPYVFLRVPTNLGTRGTPFFSKYIQIERFGHSLRFTFTTSTSLLCLSRHGRQAQLWVLGQVVLLVFLRLISLLDEVVFLAARCSPWHCQIMQVCPWCALPDRRWRLADEWTVAMYQSSFGGPSGIFLIGVLLCVVF